MPEQQIPSAMTDSPQTEGMQPTEADQVTDPSMAPFDDDAGGPTADKEQMDEPGEEEAAAQMGSLS